MLYLFQAFSNGEPYKYLQRLKITPLEQSEMDNIKLKTSLNRFFEKVKQKSFDEYDVKILLIDIREFIREQTFLREVADSIAHPERNKGICHQAIDSRYARMKMAKIGSKKLLDDNEFERNKDKSERYFSDKILDYLDPKKISIKDYELFVKNSLDDIDELLFVKFYKLKRNEIKVILDKSYKKINGFFELKTSVSHTQFLRIEDILKFLRGTITTRGVVTGDGLKDDLRNAITRINRLSGFSLSIKEIEDSMDSIIICILALLHDCKFLMYDSTESKAYLSIHGKIIDEKAVPVEFHKYSLALMIDADNFKFPIITTDIVYDLYIDELIDPEYWHLKNIPWIQTNRMDSNLKLNRLPII